MGVVVARRSVRRFGVVVRVALAVVVVIIVYLMVTVVQVWWTGRRYDPRPAGAIVVMGAAQYDGVPSPTWPPGSTRPNSCGASTTPPSSW